MNKAELDREIERTPDGKHRMALLRKGWEMADRNNDYDAGMSYRLEHMKQSCFHDDDLEIYIVFPEILKMHDERIKECGHDQYTYNILWRYKWVLQNAASFYQISIEQYEMFWQDCKKRYLQNNYSLRPLYVDRFTFYLDIDRAEAAKAYNEFINCKRDSMSDCHACERASEVSYLVGIGELEKAKSKAEPLIQGSLRCEEALEYALGDFLDYYIDKIAEGDRDYAEPASEICETLRKSIEKKGVAGALIPNILMFYALENPRKALNYYKKHWSFFEETRNPVSKFEFAVAALCFLKNLGDKKTYKMVLGSAFPFYNEKDTYDVEMLRRHYQDAALDIAEKMDKRNGTTEYMDFFNRFTV